MAGRGRAVATRSAQLLGLGALATAVLVALPFPLCPTARVLGVPCPGCGMTRASLALLRGHLREAVALHPLVPIVLPLVAWLVGREALAFVRGRPVPLDPRLARATTPLAIGLAIAVLGVWIARFFGHFGGPVPV